MKKLLLLSSCLFSITLSAQIYVNNFEGAPNLPVYISATAGNIWQVGTPSKVFFDSAYTMPNAIVTDTLNPYPVNNVSSFFFSIPGPLMLNLIELQFIHKFDTDSLYDGGYIEMSTDHGFTWINVADNPYLATTNPYGGDTIVGGIKAFTGNSGGWTNSFIAFMYCGFPFVYDSVTFRFTFKSDSINTGSEGWVIDNLFLISQFCEGVNENQNNISEVVVYPNPATTEIRIESTTKIESIEIYDILGQKVLHAPLSSRRGDDPMEHRVRGEGIDITTLTPGIYFVKVKTETEDKVAKFVKQ